MFVSSMDVAAAAAAAAVEHVMAEEHSAVRLVHSDLLLGTIDVVDANSAVAARPTALFNVTASSCSSSISNNNSTSSLSNSNTYVATTTSTSPANVVFRLPLQQFLPCVNVSIVQLVDCEEESLVGGRGGGGGGGGKSVAGPGRCTAGVPSSSVFHLSRHNRPVHELGTLRYESSPATTARWMMITPADALQWAVTVPAAALSWMQMQVPAAAEVPPWTTISAQLAAVHTAFWGRFVLLLLVGCVIQLLMHRLTAGAAAAAAASSAEKQKKHHRRKKKKSAAAPVTPELAPASTVTPPSGSSSGFRRIHSITAAAAAAAHGKDGGDDDGNNGGSSPRSEESPEFARLVFSDTDLSLNPVCP